MSIELEKSRPVFRDRSFLIVGASVLLAFFCGMGVMNGIATQKAIVATATTAKGDCHYQLRIERQRLSNTPELRP